MDRTRNDSVALWHSLVTTSLVGDKYRIGRSFRDGFRRDLLVEFLPWHILQTENRVDPHAPRPSPECRRA